MLNILNNLTYFWMVKKNEFYNDTKRGVKSRTSLNNFIMQYLKPQEFPDAKSSFIEYIEHKANSYNLSFRDLFTESVCIKMNLLCLFFSILIMVFYAFLIHSLLELLRNEKKKLLSKADEEKQSESNLIFQIDFIFMSLVN